MTAENQKRLYNHLVSIGRHADAKAIDNIYNFTGSKKVEKNVLDKVAENKVKVKKNDK